ncbi:MAG: hypothetical protein Q9163_001689 [Psora crenata]
MPASRFAIVIPLSSTENANEAPKHTRNALPVAGYYDRAGRTLEAVVAIATWVNNYHFVVDIRSHSLSLTASLHADQLSSSLFLLLSSVQAISTRVIIQSALQRYALGNNTDANWVRATSDIQSALGTGAGASVMLLQAQIFSMNGTGLGGPYSLINVTASGVLGTIPLPYLNPNGSRSYLGDNVTGYPEALYPSLQYNSTIVNATLNVSHVFFAGNRLHTNSSVFLGPWLLNETFGLVSVTVPVNNNTCMTDNLGWLTVVINARSIMQTAQSVQGLGDTGQILIVSPDTPDQRLPPTIQGNLDSLVDRDLAKTQNVRFVIPPTQNSSRSRRHQLRTYGTSNAPFEMQDYPVVLDVYSSNGDSPNGASSRITTHNEEHKQVSAGFALPMSSMVDWALIVEQSHGEVTAPINHLRNVLLACVFGTIGGVLLFLLPIAHFSVRPIRRLRAATEKTIEPQRLTSNEGSFQSIASDNSHAQDSADEHGLAGAAKKEGLLGRLTSWPTTRHGRDKVHHKQGEPHTFRIPGKVQDRKHIVHDELTDLTRTFNEMSEELSTQYTRLEERVRERTQELEISKKAAEVANETKTLFIANISHELKTPLNGILGMCAVSMQEDDPIKIKRSLGIIYKSGDLLLHLLTDLLTFTKNQMGQQVTLDEREFRLGDVSSQVISIFEKQAKEGGISLRITYQGPQDISGSTTSAPLQQGHGPYGTGRVKDMYLWGDQHRILQVIINLVSNSLKFTPPKGSVDVRIRCLGDVPEKAESRNGSVASRQPKRPSSRGSKRGIVGRLKPSSSSSVSPLSRGRDESNYSDTALHINGRGPRSTPVVAVRDRSSSPLPANARDLLFEFEVEDTGPGIPASQQLKVFEPFMQGDLGLSKKYGGTGLGLSICSQLATLMRGSIRLDSQVGRGSKFTMRIPLAFTKERADSIASSMADSKRSSINLDSTADPVAVLRRRSSSDLSTKSDRSISPAINGFDAPAKPRLVGLSQPFFAAASPLDEADKQLVAMERVAAQAAQSGGKVRLLVAEDNRVNQEVVLRMLKLEDIYDVTVAKDGQEAFELVKESMEKKKYFDLIFMDVQMPNLDGIQSTKLIRGMGFSAPIVALTAFAEESNVKECMDSGMDFFLPKPIRRPALKQVLKRYCPTIPEATEEHDGTPEKKEFDREDKSKDSGWDDAVSPMS